VPIEEEKKKKYINIVDDIEIGKLEWLGLFIRMENERIPKEKVLNGKFNNTRPAGKPRTRWEDVIRRDTLLGMQGWRRRAEDGEKWSVF
jgi:hypothetical protein